MPKQSGLLHFFSGQHWLILLTAVVIFAIIAWPASFYFLNDDLLHIPLSADGEMGHHNSVRYIGDLSLMADVNLFGKAAWGFHLTNLILHLFNSFLFFVILKRLTGKDGPTTESWFVLYATCFFLAFAFHSDAIFWIIGRSASLGAFFLLCTVYVLITPNQNSILKIIFISIFWLLSLFTYESVWFLPLWVTLIYFLPINNRYIKITLVEILCLWVLFFAYMVIRWNETGAWLGTYEAKHFEDLSISMLLMNYAKLILRTFIPPLSASILYIIIGILVGLFFTALLILNFRKRQFSTTLNIFVIGWMLSYLPYLSLGISLKTIESERFLYLPSMLFAGLFFYMLCHWVKERNQRLFIHSISIFIITWHFFVLHSNAQSYKLAGQVVMETFQTIAALNLSGADTLTIKGLPKTIKGVPAFRLGFEDGYKWLHGEMPHVIIEDSMAFNNPVKAMIARQPNGALLIFDEP